jgi:Putative transposase
LMLEKLVASHKNGMLAFYGEHATLADPKAFAKLLQALKRTRWFVYCKRPFAGPKAVLAYLSRYTHRVAISNSRLIGADEKAVTFRVKDYRIDGPDRYKTMTLAPAEFIRRFMLHVLPKGFHRIRHYGLLARGAAKAQTLARVRELIAAARPEDPLTPKQQDTNNPASSADEPIHPCPCCGGRMVIIEAFEAGTIPRYWRTTPTIVDTS